jgi:hypothetical protein
MRMKEVMHLSLRIWCSIHCSISMSIHNSIILLFHLSFHHSICQFFILSCCFIIPLFHLSFHHQSINSSTATHAHSWSIPKAWWSNHHVSNEWDGCQVSDLIFICSIGNPIWLSYGWTTTKLHRVRLGNLSYKPSYFFSLTLKVHSHLVLGTLMLSSLTPYLHTYITPTYLRWRFYVELTFT